MQLIPDDPIISAIERTGYPPWMQGDDEDDAGDPGEEEDADED